jgi:hypothetical protein
MPQKTARQTKKRRADPPPEQPGLIANGKNSHQSATTKSVLDNRSHRTTLPAFGSVAALCHSPIMLARLLTHQIFPDR